MSPGPSPGALGELLERARAAGVFSAAAWAVGDADRTVAAGTLGSRARPELAADDDLDASDVDGSELYDLASVTKPLLAVAVLALVESGELSLDGTVGAVLSGFRGSPVGTATLRGLLLHTSGLPGRVPLYLEHGDRESLLAALARLPLANEPGTWVDYSSQGFVLLGLIAEAATGRALDTIIDDLVSVPAGARTLTFDPAASGLPCVATERCAWRGRVVQGQVHDENAVVLGAPAGHAGLFGTLDDVAAIGRALVRNAAGPVLLGPAALSRMTRTTTSGLNLARNLGWQRRDAVDPFAGHRVGPQSYGHTGFTGTSLVVDPDAARWYVLLTNRVHPSRDDTRILGVRRSFHDVASGIDPG